MIDIKHTDDGDIDISGGDIRHSESTEQHQKDITIADKGHYKEYPAIGVGAINHINDIDPENFLRTLRREFTRDGMTVRRVAIANGEIETHAEYDN